MKQQLPYVRLVCEGAMTEPNYFTGYLCAKGLKQPQMAYKPKDHSPRGVAIEAKKVYRDAIKLKYPPEKILVAAVFDRDGHVKVDEAMDILRGTPIVTAFSNICFEFWILLHF
jgi:hypothetical protein